MGMTCVRHTSTRIKYGIGATNIHTPRIVHAHTCTLYIVHEVNVCSMFGVENMISDVTYAGMEVLDVDD